MSYEFIQVRRDDRVTTITLNRPEVLNALHPPLYRELSAAYGEFCADPAQWVCILTGAGRAFCAGADIKYAARARVEGRTPADDYGDGGVPGLLDRYDDDKPLIAAINGPALGGGFEIALACDLIVAADTAFFALPEPRVGAVAQGGGVHRLARQIGLKPAMGIVLTGRRVSAEEGLRLGFVNEVVSAVDVEAAARRWAGLVAECAPLAVRASKQMTMRGLDEASLATALRNQGGYPAFRRWADSDEACEGAAAFAQRRAPSWGD